MSVRGPKSDNRTIVLGSTGSGKTQFGTALLSTRDFHQRPWFIFDFKGDELLNSTGAQEISISSRPPTKPGLYIIKPLPGDEELVSQFFYYCWLQEYCGIYIDEGYMVPKLDRWFRACLTQGRSKQIEMIILSQRPRWMDTFTYTEASFIAVFNLTFLDDRKHIRAYTGGVMPSLLPNYHCLWYDVARQSAAIMEPVPEADELIARFQSRLENRPRKI